MRQETNKSIEIGKNKAWSRLLLPVSLFLLMVILSACAGAPAAPEAPAATEAPAQPEKPSEQYPVQYGQDTRMEPFQHSDEKLKEMAASVAILVHKSQVSTNGNLVTLGGYTLNEMSEMGWLVSGAELPICAGELFSSQPAPGYCTGFLVGEDILVTAGHCLQKTPCSDTQVVFGFQMEPDGSLTQVTREDVFKCKQVLAQVAPGSENGNLDYAIIKLDRSTGRAGLSYSSDDLLQAQDNVAVLGYPSGLPQKIASNAFVLINDVNTPFFVANLDTFGSNSGSPVINMDTYQVEGILVSGMTDYVLSVDGSCVQVNRCPEGGSDNCAGESAMKMARLAEVIQDSSTNQIGGLVCPSAALLVAVLLTVLYLKNH